MIAQFALISLLILSSTWAGEDFYELLGVARDADDRTIRKAFKKIAIQKHPDKNPVSDRLLFKQLTFTDFAPSTFHL